MINDINRNMHRKFCQSVRKQMTGKFIKIDSLQETLEYEMSVTMADQKASITALKHDDWEDTLVENILAKKGQKLKLTLFNQIHQYKLENFRNAKDSVYLGVYLGRDILMGTYFDGKVKYVPDTNNGSNYIDNCIAYKHMFIFGSEAKEYLTDTYGSFDIKDLLWKDEADVSELQKYPFMDLTTGPITLNLPSKKDPGMAYRIYIETLVAQQVLDIKHAAEFQIKGAVRMAVFTVRTDYRIRQRAILGDVTKIAGFETSYVITEITAAAMAYLIDKTRDSMSKEIIMVFALDHDHCDYALIRLTNTCIEYLSYGSHSVATLMEFGTGSSYPIIIDYITNEISIKQLSETDLSKILVVGQSDRLVDLKTCVSNHFAPKPILYDCPPRDIIAKGTAYYGQMLEKRLDTIEIKEVVKMPINMLVHINNKNVQYKLMEQNVSVFVYRKLSETNIKVSGDSFPIHISIIEGDEQIKLFVVDRPPPATWSKPIGKLADKMFPWNTLLVSYHMDQDTLDIHFSATLKAKTGDHPISLIDSKVRLTQTDISGQRSIINKLGTFKLATDVQSKCMDTISIPSTSSGQVLHEVKSVPNKQVDTNRMTAPSDEFSAFCAGIRNRLDSSTDIFHRKKAKLLDKLTASVDIVRKDGKQLDQQKREILEMIDTFKLRDKLIPA